MNSEFVNDLESTTLLVKNRQPSKKNYYILELGLSRDANLKERTNC